VCLYMYTYCDFIYILGAAATHASLRSKSSAKMNLIKRLVWVCKVLKASSRLAAKIQSGPPPDLPVPYFAHSVRWAGSRTPAPPKGRIAEYILCHTYVICHCQETNPMRVQSPINYLWIPSLYTLNQFRKEAPLSKRSPPPSPMRFSDLKGARLLFPPISIILDSFFAIYSIV
jgi:hypothetical protein